MSTEGGTTTPEADARFETARAVADAVLYEGYVLYPYRASARKNQVRFQWGVLTPRTYSEADGSERWWLRAECLVEPRTRSTTSVFLNVRVRCLQTQRRAVEAIVDGPGTEPSFMPVPELRADGTVHVPWDEAVDRIVDLAPLEVPFPALDPLDLEQPFELAGDCETESLVSSSGHLVGRFVRRREPVQGVVRLHVAPATGGGPLCKVSVAVENTTPGPGPGAPRADAMAQSLLAVHVMLAAQRGAFVSLLDPPPHVDDAVGDCRSDGTYPVLIGDGSVVLSSPIILYDNPEVAPQSPGDLYDALEIDEILALRVMTLTDAEKSEARGTDARAAAIIDRCDTLSPAALSRLHGEMRLVEPAAPWWDPAADASVDPWSDSVRVAGVDVRQGSRVRLRPSGRADAQDMFLDGCSATVAGVFGDVDGGFHLAVTVDDDPAGDELVWQGRYLYFHPDEVEPMPNRESAP